MQIFMFLRGIIMCLLHETHKLVAGLFVVEYLTGKMDMKVQHKTNKKTTSHAGEIGELLFSALVAREAPWLHASTLLGRPIYSSALVKKNQKKIHEFKKVNGLFKNVHGFLKSS